MPVYTGINAVKRYAKLFADKKEAERTLKIATEGMAELESTLIDYFQKHGIDRQSIEGVTVHLRRELWAGHEGDGPAACVALVGEHLAEYAQPRINTQSLSAYVRELEKQAEPDPNRTPGDAFFEHHPGLKGFIKVSELFKIGVRQS